MGGAMLAVKQIQGVIAWYFLSAALFLSGAGAVDAMEIKKFDQMSLNDQARYAQILIGESIKFLFRNGRFDDGEKALALFKGKPSGEIPDGMQEFINVLKELREIEDKNISQRSPHVEHAIAIVLKRHGIVVAMSDVMQFNKDFQPQDKAP